MKNIYLILTTVLFPFLIAAQDFSGVILTQRNEPIMGAYIQHARTNAHTHSNEVGQFLMEGIQVGDTLQVLHIGYETINHKPYSGSPTICCENKIDGILL